MLLGLGSKFCIEKRLASKHLNKTFSRLTRQVRLRSYFYHSQLPPTIHPLYMKSDFQPPNAPTNVEYALDKFKFTIISLTKKLSSKPHYNLTKIQRSIVNKIRNNNKITIVNADKNLGATVMNRDYYINSILNEHLKNNETYERLTNQQAQQLLLKTQNDVISTVSKFKLQLPEIDRIYFYRNFRNNHRAPIYYGPPKLHKEKKNNMVRTRPVVAKCGSFLEIASKYCDYYLTELIPFVSTYLKDTFELLSDLNKLKNIPTNAQLVTADAIGMYTNIETEHGLQTINTFIEIHKHLLPKNYPHQLISNSSPSL